MAEGQRPRFTTLEADIRREQLAAESAEAELSARFAEDAAKANLLADRLTQLMQFVVDHGGTRATLVVFNMLTGQAAAAKAVGTNPQIGFRRQDARYYDWSRLQRIRVSEAGRLLRLGTCHLTPIARWGYENDIGGQPYPEWLFEPTDERQSEWTRSAHSIHFRAFIALWRSNIASLFELMRIAMSYLLALMLFVLIGLLLYTLLTGGFGRGQ